jgi:hypothetical protein
MGLRLLREDALRVAADPLVLGHFADAPPLAGSPARLDWILNGLLSRAWRSRPDLFSRGHLTLLDTGGKFPFPRALLVGLGPRARFTREERRESYRIALQAAGKVGGAMVAIEPFPLGDDEAEAAGTAEHDLRTALDSLPRSPGEVTLIERPVTAGKRAR